MTATEWYFVGLGVGWFSGVLGIIIGQWVARR